MIRRNHSYYGSGNQVGFTLVELAIVLVIVGVLLGGFIGTLASRIEVTRYDETREELEDVKAALIAYAFSKGAGGPYLPCPDGDGDGEAELTCTAVGEDMGSLPRVTLGLGAADAWNNRYEYWVKNTFSDSATVFDLSTSANGRIETRSNDGTTLELVANNVVAVIFSRGKNGLGAVGTDGSLKAAIPATGHTDEEENEDGNIIFVSRSPTYEDDTTDVGTFDDIVIWISEYELKAKMVEAGVLP